MKEGTTACVISYGIYTQNSPELPYFQFRDSLAWGASHLDFGEHIQSRADFHQFVCETTWCGPTHEDIIREYQRFEKWIMTATENHERIFIVRLPTLDGILFECFVSYFITNTSPTWKLIFNNSQFPMGTSNQSLFTNSHVATKLEIQKRSACWNAFVAEKPLSFIELLETTFEQERHFSKSFQALLSHFDERQGPECQISQVDRYLFQKIGNKQQIQIVDWYASVTENPWVLGPEFLLARLIQWSKVPTLQKELIIKRDKKVGRLNGYIELTDNVDNFFEKIATVTESPIPSIRSL